MLAFVVLIAVLIVVFVVTSKKYPVTALVPAPLPFDKRMARPFFQLESLTIADPNAKPVDPAEVPPKVARIVESFVREGSGDDTDVVVDAAAIVGDTWVVYAEQGDARARVDVLNSSVVNSVRVTRDMFEPYGGFQPYLFESNNWSGTQIKLDSKDPVDRRALEYAKAHGIDVLAAMKVDIANAPPFVKVYDMAPVAGNVHSWIVVGVEIVRGSGQYVMCIGRVECTSQYALYCASSRACVFSSADCPDAKAPQPPLGGKTIVFSDGSGARRLFDKLADGRICEVGRHCDDNQACTKEYPYAPVCDAWGDTHVNACGVPPETVACNGECPCEPYSKLDESQCRRFENNNGYGWCPSLAQCMPTWTGDMCPDWPAIDNDQKTCEERSWSTGYAWCPTLKKCMPSWDDYLGCSDWPPRIPVSE